MVLTQEDGELKENFIYYLSWGSIGLELNFSHVEKLALVLVHVVQQLHHSILLEETIVIANVNPFQFFLTGQVVGEKFSKWIVIL